MRKRLEGGAGALLVLGVLLSLWFLFRYGAGFFG
jgi:hypothetical protein